MPTIWAQSDGVPRQLRERINRTLVDEGFPSAAAAFDTEVKITASDGAAGGRFGHPVAISGDTAIVGALYGDNDNGVTSGSAYLYQRDESGGDHWGEVTEIHASDGDAIDFFGASVAINGDTAIVGAPRSDGFGAFFGSAIVYRRNEGGENNWGEVKTITASDGDRGDQFGSFVAISEDTAIVAAERVKGLTGSAYVYFTDSPETIGGAVYTDCDRRLTSGEEGVEVTVSGAKGVFTAVTGERSGAWKIADVPRGEYTVTAHRVFREYCRVDIGGDCPAESCGASARITVDAEHRAENLSIQFLGQSACVANDLNDDGVCTVTFDTELFLQCVYDDDCVGPDGQDLECAADCNCDGMATIVFDASCFMHDVYVKGVCGECQDDGQADDSRRPEQPRTASGFTIGGAVYDDAANPLVSGIEGVTVQVFGLGRKMAATATTAGPSGIWRVDDLPSGTYTVVFEHSDAITVVVNGENEEDNLSIGLLRPRDPSRRRADRVR